MPIALLLPALTGLISGAVTALVISAVQFFTKKLAVRLVVIAGWLAALGIMWSALQSIAAGIQRATPAWINIALGWVVPDNLDTCIAACASATLVRMVYDWKTRTTALLGN